MEKVFIYSYDKIMEENPNNYQCTISCHAFWISFPLLRAYVHIYTQFRSHHFRYCCYYCSCCLFSTPPSTKVTEKLPFLPPHRPCYFLCFLIKFYQYVFISSRLLHTFFFTAVKYFLLLCVKLNYRNRNHHGSHSFTFYSSLSLLDDEACSSVLLIILRN